MSSISKSLHYTLNASTHALVFVIPGRKYWLQMAFFSYMIFVWGFLGYWGGGMLILILKGVIEDWLPTAQRISDYAAGIPIILFTFLFGGTWVLGGARIFYSFLWQLFGLETIRVSKQAISVDRKVLSLRSQRIYRSNEVNNLRVMPFRELTRWHSELRGRFNNGAIAFDCGKRTYRCGYELEELEAREIVDMIKHRYSNYAVFGNSSLANQLSRQHRRAGE